MKKKIIALAAVILTALFLSTFIEKDIAYKDDNKDSVIMAVDSLKYDFDKFSDLSKDDENIICATCRGLVKLNNNKEVTLDMAKDLDVSKDGIEYNFTLKDDVCWSDGEKIKPEEILMYFKYLIQKEDKSNIKALLNIYGAEKFKEGIGTFENDVALTSDGNNIKIRLNKKDDTFLDELSKPQYRIRRNLSLWKDVSSNYKRISYSGDYSINRISENSLELRKNDNEYAKKIVMIKDESKEDSMASYEVGERDIVVDPPVSQVSRLDENKRILSSPSGEGIYLSINSDKLNSSVRKEFVKVLYKAAESYYDENKKAVKFAEGSYFEKEMDELDKLQSRKVSIGKGEEGSIPSKIKVLIEDNDIEEDFIKFAADYFSKNEDVVISYSDKEEDDDDKDFDMSLLSLKEDFSDKSDLYAGMQKVFREENQKYFTNTSKVEENLFNSYVVVPIMFTNKNIAVSNKVSNIRFDGNGNIDFLGLD